MDYKNIPNEWFCPITQEVMTDPVIGPDGYTYERKQIQQWLLKNSVSPITREKMVSKNLIPNKALKSTIQQMLPEYVKHGANLKRQKIEIAKQYQEEDELNLQADSIILNDKLHVNVSVVPPQEKDLKKRKRVAIICVLDISGSMDTEATIKNGNDTESHGFTRLDLVKHSVNTIIHSLDDGDLLALVPFSNNGRVDLPLTNMNENGKKIAQKTLNNLNTQGSTNIWDGLRVGLDLSANQQCDKRNVFVILLTDGEPNINPPQGILPTLKKYVDSTGLTSNIHVFGYGYQLDTVLLTGIAEVGLGSYGYIPDCSMVGTIFVNFLSNALSTITNLIRLTIKPEEGIKYLGTYDGDQSKVLNLGGIQYGQSRDNLLMFQVPEHDKTFVEIQLSYGYGLRKNASILISSEAPKNKNELFQHLNRATHIKGLKDALGFANNLPQGLKVIKNTLKQLKNSPITETDPFTKLLIRDIESGNQNEGQVFKAFQKKEWYIKWGKHYIPSLLLAHRLQICTNFKDPGLQNYGGKLFKTLQNEIDTIFIKLPAPQPTIKKPEYVAPANMASYYNYGGGCIAGNCKIILSNGEQKLISSLQKGDIVKTPNNSSSKIICVLKTRVNSLIEMIHFTSGLVITPYHPIKVNNIWTFPIDLGKSVKEYVTEYYNFVLQKDHIMIVNGIECVTLAHGLKDNKVVQHEYLGTSKILDDLKSQKGWEDGLINIGKFERDPISLRITKMIELI